MKYRKKPVVIEAVQYRGENWKELIDAFVPNFDTPLVVVRDDEGTVYDVQIDTKEGTMQVSLGDYVIRGVKGELYPCKPDIFAATYDPVE